MLFKDREDAGEKLLALLLKDEGIKKKDVSIVVASLLRGGIIVGNSIAKGLDAKHLPLVVSKITAPYNPELAIGALCFDFIYLDKEVIRSIDLDKTTIQNQIRIARDKFRSYLERFELIKYSFALKKKLVILIDDGVATGSTVKAAFLYLKSKSPRSIFLAVPVAPKDFEVHDFDKSFILYEDPFFKSVSQFYKYFPQVDDQRVKTLLFN